ncbi:Hypothetical predicted protein [Olea europaea subsp. europaea]|uniref:Uncharacterized protein n=1 Tax=Olea europaea subsp. europaea TaxID=158383 RepID=A0A8S0RBW9_OLEEU|nr:Hypothetical predicted protein [Olea europaea subsp. europaea]
MAHSAEINHRLPLPPNRSPSKTTQRRAQSPAQFPIAALHPSQSITGAVHTHCTSTNVTLPRPSLQVVDVTVTPKLNQSPEQSTLTPCSPHHQLMHQRDTTKELIV